jgi:hypothetical protein
MAARADRLVRRTAIATGLATIAGFGAGVAAGAREDPTSTPPVRRLPSDLCERLGDVGVLFPAGVRLRQTGGSAVRCAGTVDEAARSSYTGAQLTVTFQTYAAVAGDTAAAAARKDFDKTYAPRLDGRAHPTKLSAKANGEDSWHIVVVTTYADLVVRVDYTAEPVTRQAAESAALLLAEKAVWEAR